MQLDTIRQTVSRWELEYAHLVLSCEVLGYLKSDTSR